VAIVISSKFHENRQSSPGDHRFELKKKTSQQMILLATNTENSCNLAGIMSWKQEDDPVVERVEHQDTKVINGRPDRISFVLFRLSQDAIETLIETLANQPI
jgi:hypothetical protein